MLFSLLFLFCLTSLEICRCIIEPDAVEITLLEIVADDVAVDRLDNIVGGVES